MTIADSVSNEFVMQANKAYMKIASGAFDYDTAIKQGINQTATQITLDNCDDLDCELVEVSAHIGARPAHEAWQGKIYSLNPDNKKYPYFYDVCGYGDPDGIYSINCRHSFYPYFEGTEKLYSKGELDEYKDQSVTYIDEVGEPHKLTVYEAEQKQRQIERNIRRYKREAVGLTENGYGDSPECLAARNKLYRWQEAQRDFVKQTGLKRDYTREYVGSKNSEQIRGLKIYVDDENTDIASFGKFVKKINLEKTKISESMNFAEANNGKPNPNYKKEGGKSNCQTATAAYFARTLGYNVQARTRVNNVYMNALAYDTSLAYIDVNTGKSPDYLIPSVTRKKALYDWLNKNIEVQKLYTFQFGWKGRKDGHIVHVWKNKNGNIILYDPQPDIKAIKKNLNIQNFYFDKIRINTVKLLNLSNCILNKDFVSHIFEEVK